MSECFVIESMTEKTEKKRISDRFMSILNGNHKTA